MLLCFKNNLIFIDVALRWYCGILLSFTFLLLKEEKQSKKINNFDFGTPNIKLTNSLLITNLNQNTILKKLIIQKIFYWKEVLYRKFSIELGLIQTIFNIKKFLLSKFSIAKSLIPITFYRKEFSKENSVKIVYA